MTKYDDLFDDTAPTESVFRDKGALDPLTPPEEIIARDKQEHQLARILNGVHEGYLPTTVSVYGPPGTGKTMTTRRVCEEFAARTDFVAVEYVNLKECRTIFSAANEILFELTGEKAGSYVGLDGVFTAIWEALVDYPEWTICILDEIDQLRYDSNYDPNEFFYRLLRGEGKQKRGIKLSAWTISNELVIVDLRVDSRVESVMSDERVFFGHYDETHLAAILRPRIDRAFREEALPEEAFEIGVAIAADRWGDARKALELFRQAGETANERGLTAVSEDCLDANVEHSERESLIDRIVQLPETHLLVLTAAVSWERADGSIVQPVTTGRIQERLQRDTGPDAQLSDRAIRQRVTDLETMGLVETWIDSRGSEGRVKQIEIPFDPQWVRDAQARYVTTQADK